MLTFTGTGRRVYTNQASGAAFRAAPSVDGGGLCPAFMNTNGINQDFSVVAWVKPGWAGSSQYSVFSMTKGLVLKTGSSNVVEGRLAARDGTLTSGSADQNTGALIVTTSGQLVLNEWNLVAMSFNSTSKVLRVSVFNSANPAGSFTNSAAYSVVPPTAVEDCPTNMAVGGGGGFLDFVGSMNVAMFGRQASDADLLAIYSSKNYLATLSYIRDTYSEPDYVAFGYSIPGSMVNEANAAVASTWPVAGVTTTGTSGSAPNVWPYLDSGRTRGTDLTTHRGITGWLNNVGGNICRFDSHDAETFFTRQVPATARAPGAIPGPSTALLVMYAGIAASPGRHWTIVASNSRGVRRPSAGGQTLPERHSEAYMAEKRSLISGVLNGRPWESSTEATNAFGVRIAQGETVQGSGTKVVLQTTTGWTDFTRAWTGGDNNGAGISQGMGVVLTTTNAVWGLKFSPEYGSRFDDSHPIRVRYHLLAYPGHCGSVLYRRTKSQNQAAGVDIDAADTTVTGFDTTVATRTYNTGTDSYTSGTKTVVINANLVAQGVRVGHLLVNVSLVSAAEIASISWDGSNTTIVLTTTLGQSPANGHVFKFGPWETRAIVADFPAINFDGGDLNAYRGLLIKAPASFPSNTLGVVLLAMDAWSTDVDGLIIGHAGYSGNGYQNQLTDCWQNHAGTSDSAITNFYKKMFDQTWTPEQAMSFNVFLHHADQQVANPGLINYTNVVKAAVQDVSVAYMGDQVHAVDADVVNWDTFVFQQGGTLAVSVTADTRLGTLAEQWALGHRTDSAHPSALGLLRNAQANIARGGPLASPQNRLRRAPGMRRASAPASAAGQAAAAATGRYAGGLTFRRSAGRRGQQQN